jgi:hypothetical protein
MFDGPPLVRKALLYTHRLLADRTFTAALFGGYDDINQTKYLFKAIVIQTMRFLSQGNKRCQRYFRVFFPA